MDVLIGPLVQSPLEQAISDRDAARAELAEVSKERGRLANDPRLADPNPMDDLPSLVTVLVHRSLLEELGMWSKPVRVRIRSAVGEESKHATHTMVCVEYRGPG